MTAAALIAPNEQRSRDVTAWRIERLLAAGYDGEASLVLALDREVDLHRAITLLERGCGQDLALQILL